MPLLRLFKNNRTTGVVLVILIAVLTHLVSFIHPPGAVEWQDMPLYDLIFGPLNRFPLLSGFIAILIHLLIALILIRINIRYPLIEERTYMPAIFYLLIANALPVLHQVNPMLIGSLFYLISFRMLIDTHDEQADTYRIFNASLVFFLGTLFYARLIWFFPVLLIILLTIRSLTLREFIYPFVAGIFTGLILFTYYWVVEGAGWKLASALKENLGFTRCHHPMHFSIFIYIGFILLLVMISSAFIVRRYQVKKIIIRNIYEVLLYMFLFSFLFYFLLSGLNQGAIFFMAIPLTYLLSKYFHQHQYAFIKELFIWILIGLTVFVQISVR